MSKKVQHEWHEQQEKILKEWSEISASYRYMHDRAHGKFYTQNLWFALPVIIISTITGTANFAQESFPDEAKVYAPLAIGFLNLTAGLITTIAQFLRVSEKLEGHRASSIAYSKLARNIQVELSLPVSERTIDGSSFIMECRAQLDRLLEQGPNLDDKVISKFDEKFKNHKFFKPAIIDLRPVEVYKDDVEEEARKKQKLLEEGLAFRKRILEEESKHRKSILKQEKLDKKRSMIEMRERKKKKAQDRLNNITAADIGEKMSKLLSNIENQKTSLIMDDSSSDDDSTPKSGMSDKISGDDAHHVTLEIIESTSDSDSNGLNENDVENATVIDISNNDAIDEELTTENDAHIDADADATDISNNNV